MFFCFNVLKVKPILDAFDGRWNIYSKIPRPESARRSLQWIFRRYESVFLARAKARGLQLGLVDPEEFWFFSVGAHVFFEASKETVCLVNCGGFQKRAFVIYDGIHYDVLVRRGPSGPGTWNLADVE